MMLLMDLQGLLGPRLMGWVLHIVALGYYLASPATRRVCRHFLRRARAKGSPKADAGPGGVYRLIHSFACTLIDKVAAWQGEMGLKRIRQQGSGLDQLVVDLKAGRGALLLSSHLGNAELLRASTSREVHGGLGSLPLTCIMDTGVNSQFSRFIKRVNPGAAMRLISPGSLGPDTVVILQDRLAAGELVIIAGDRTPAKSHGRAAAGQRLLWEPFLGKAAPFPQGPFLLASLLDCPVYFIFGLRRNAARPGTTYDFLVRPATTRRQAGRQGRQAAMAGFCHEFVECLESLCLLHPYQWYNFFDFWEMN